MDGNGSCGLWQVLGPAPVTSYRWADLTRLAVAEWQHRRRLGEAFGSLSRAGAGVPPAVNPADLLRLLPQAQTGVASWDAARHRPGDPPW